MKKLKRLFAALLAYALIFSFAACTGDSKNQNENKQNNVENEMFEYKAIEANNPEGKIVSAVDKTVFGSKSLAADVTVDNQEFFNGKLKFGEKIEMSELSLTVCDYSNYYNGERVNHETEIGAYNGSVIVSDVMNGVYLTADAVKILNPSAEDFDYVLKDLTGAGIEEWVAQLASFGIEISYEKVLDWKNRLVNGSISKNVLGEIFNGVIKPYFVALSRNLTYGEETDGSLEASDIPDFDVLLDIVYDFFIEGHSANAFNISVNGNKYDVNVDLIKLVDLAINYVKDHEKLQSFVNSDAGVYLIGYFESIVDILSHEEIAKDYRYGFTVEITDGYISYFGTEGIEIKLSDFNNIDSQKDYDALVAQSKALTSVADFKDIKTLYDEIK